MSVIFRNEDSRNVMLEQYELLLKDTPQAESRTVPTRFGDTHLLVAGRADAPPLVVLHGALANSALAIREGHALFDEFRVYVPDVIGQSPKSADVRLELDTLDYAHWVSDVLDGLELDRAHLYGASWGGFIARLFAEWAPERIDHLALLVPCGITASPVLTAMAHSGIPLLLYKTLGSQSALDRFIRGQLSTDEPSAVEYMRVALKHYKLDIRVPPLGKPERLESFKGPTLVLGAADDVNFPGAALLERARQLIPHATAELLNCRHAPPTDELSRRKLCERLSCFLRDVPCAPVVFG